jgi:hypothetical protein
VRSPAIANPFAQRGDYRQILQCLGNSENLERPMSSSGL